MNTKTEQKEWWLYGLVNPRTGSLRYCGQSCRPKVRTRAHKNKYPSLEFQKIGRCESLAEVLIWEWLMVELLDCPLNEIPGGCTSPALDPEVRKKISKSTKGRKHSAETRAKMSEAKKGKKTWIYGKKHSAETIKKLSGENNPAKRPEVRAKISAANRRRWRKGQYVHSAETKAKISVANRGKNHPNYGKKLSAETRAKLSAANKGKKHSAKRRENIRKGMLTLWERRRQENVDKVVA